MSAAEDLSKPLVHDPNGVRECLNETASPYMVALKQWLLDELKRPIESVAGIDVSSTPIEETPDGIFKQFKPGRYIIFTLTFDDGDKAAMTFDTQKEAKHE